jgi:hypothetical protein
LSTIKREFAINKGARSFRLQQAHSFAQERPPRLFEKIKLKVVVCINTFGIRSIRKGHENLMHEAKSETALASKTDPALWTRKEA